MNSKWKVIVPLAALVLVIAGAGIAYSLLKDKVDLPDAFDGTGSSTAVSSTADTSSNSRVKAPDFTVYDADGKEVTLSSLQGKPVVLNFWASWCGPCKSEMPDFQKVYEELGREVTFAMVNLTDGLQETTAKAEAHISSKGYTFPVYFDTDQDAANTYGVYSIPTTYIIDRDGYIVNYANQMVDAAALRQVLENVR